VDPEYTGICKNYGLPGEAAFVRSEIGTNRYLISGKGNFTGQAVILSDLRRWTLNTPESKKIMACPAKLLLPDTN
jgi:hypothetical protein